MSRKGVKKQQEGVRKAERVKEKQPVRGRKRKRKMRERRMRRG